MKKEFVITSINAHGNGMAGVEMKLNFDLENNHKKGYPNADDEQGTVILTLPIKVANMFSVGNIYFLEPDKSGPAPVS